MIHLKGHTALITGSTLGVGRSIAEAFAEAGSNVIIHSRKAGPDSEAALAACRKYGVRAEFIGADLTEPTETVVPQLFERVLALFDRPTILVNNAGRYFDQPFEQMTVELFERTMRLNVASGYFLTQAFAKFWQEKQIDGRVLFIGSINGRLAEEQSTAYDTSKGAMEMMVKTLAVALAPKNIRVNGMAPGLVITPQTSWVNDRPDDAAWIKHHTPNGQIPSSDVCAPAAVFLCSDAAAHVHGQMLVVDGGMSAQQQPSRGDYFKRP